MQTIKEHMRVLDSNGEELGTVDSTEGDKFIKLTKNSSPDGQHHWINRALVQTIEDDAIRLSQTAQEVRDTWHNANPLGMESSMNGTDETR